MGRPVAAASTASPTSPAPGAVPVDLAAQRVARRIGPYELEAVRGSVLDSLDARIAVLDGSGTILVANASWQRFCVAEGGRAIVGTNYLDACDAATADGLRAVLAGEQRRFESEYRLAAGGQPRWFVLRATREAISGSTRVIVEHDDITVRRGAQEDARVNASLLEVVDVGIVATDALGVVTHWNAGAERAMGWSADEMVGQSLHRLAIDPADAERALAIRAHVRQTGRWEGRFDVRRRDGTMFPALVRNVALTDAEGTVTGVVGFTLDLSVIVDAERQLRSAHDFSRAVTDSIGEGVCALDVNGQVLYMNPMAEHLLGWAEAELVGHALPDCPIRTAGHRGEVAQCDDGRFKRRDGIFFPVSYIATPFDAPNGMRGTVLVFSDLTERQAALQQAEQSLEALEMTIRIRDALAEERFVLHAQPIIDLATDEVVQHELLIRMLDRDGELVAPCAFLPAAERHGLIGDIDRWVIGQAAELAGRGNAVELNISADSLGRPDLLDVVRRELRRTGADPALMVFELTETAILRSDEAGEQFVAGIVALGCGLALDDFGTGYGGFTYLKRFAVDFLKIDMEFVRDLPQSKASQHVVRAVVSLARAFGQRTVAEGVEDADTLALLREYGVDYAQGFFLGRPAPLGETMNAGLPSRSAST